MKKVLSALLAAAILLSGCTQAVSNDTDISAPDMAASLSGRMQKDIDTRTLNGFTRETEFGEAVETIGAGRIERAQLVYIVDFLGYPAVMFCYFKYYGGGELSLTALHYYILIRNEADIKSEIEDILAKLDEELGSHTTHSDDYHDYETSFWKKDEACIEMTICGTSTEAGTLASISADLPEGVKADTPRETPGIFRYSLGGAFSAVYQNETPGETPQRFAGSQICYVDDDCTVYLYFDAESGELKLYSGLYIYETGITGETDAAEYLESIQKSMKGILGAPEYEHIGEPEFSGSYYFHELYMYWPGINIHAGHGKKVRIEVDINEEYIGNTEAAP